MTDEELEAYFDEKRRSARAATLWRLVKIAGWLALGAVAGGALLGG